MACAKEKRKRMGIEPTRHLFRPLNGFEDRGSHQTSKRFRSKKNKGLWC